MMEKKKKKVVWKRKGSLNSNPKAPNKSSVGLFNSLAKVILSAKNYLDSSLTNKG